MNDRTNYVIVTPFKNEAEFIGYTLESVTKQTILPAKWVLVDDGSTDDSIAIVNKFASEYSWISVIKLETDSLVRSGGSKVVRAFNRGYNSVLNEAWDFIVKLDADLTLPDDYFERILEYFSRNPKLGICGGEILNKYSETDLRPDRTDKYHVRGALKMIRKECWEKIGGFKETWNWDGLDIMEARFYGWDTESIDVKVIHHRPTSSAYDPVHHAFKSGYESYKMGNDIWLTFLRCAVRLKWKPYFVVSFSFFKGYLSACMKREERIVTPSLAKFIRKFHYGRFFESIWRSR